MSDNSWQSGGEQKILPADMLCVHARDFNAMHAALLEWRKKYSMNADLLEWRKIYSKKVERNHPDYFNFRYWDDWIDRGGPYIEGRGHFIRKDLWESLINDPELKEFRAAMTHKP